jgi:hypothetical protein
MASESFHRDDLHVTPVREGWSPEVAHTLRRALCQALRGTDDCSVSPDARQSLRPIIRTFAVSYRARQATPEATLIALKRLIGDVDRSAVDIRPIVDHDAGHELISDIIAWCIEDYYRDD